MPPAQNMAAQKSPPSRLDLLREALTRPDQALKPQQPSQAAEFYPHQPKRRKRVRKQATIQVTKTKKTATGRPIAWVSTKHRDLRLAPIKSGRNDDQWRCLVGAFKAVDQDIQRSTTF
ncbi:hypothetical protein ASPSYDRAFT_52623 [Aspergillus sydowii CBS 593.65]|uniref:Uncharacterized protein n=1 Tax=Aspergillus sydowii CBS 593.65 TaxID=1036612 RepID=A0A1L9SXQ8_9EURO|nr:uncharacterized protein ASPSYDRAFT_52623 [Aspergillus sydowii CBS 593.65]OJJ51998.1 hypothetical protein ASPSYDRAFT_52623 [Aspergillus sydowii CBS 593.65]